MASSIATAYRRHSDGLGFNGDIDKHPNTDGWADPNRILVREDGTRFDLPEIEQPIIPD